MQDLKNLEQLLSQGKITRREFLTRVSALGLMATVSPAFLTTTARAATPKKGGRFKLGVGGGATTDTIDPGTLSTTAPQMVHMQVRNCLTELNHEYKPIPELAESWDSSPDASKWTFKLRKGVEFHNGKTMDAEDVVFSINYHRGEQSKSSGKGLVDPIKDIKIDDKYSGF
jgi:peptide/nickel transport system substrate-binding protein